MAVKALPVAFLTCKQSSNPWPHICLSLHHQYWKEHNVWPHSKCRGHIFEMCLNFRRKYVFLILLGESQSLSIFKTFWTPQFVSLLHIVKEHVLMCIFWLAQCVFHVPREKWVTCGALKSISITGCFLQGCADFDGPNLWLKQLGTTQWLLANSHICVPVLKATLLLEFNPLKLQELHSPLWNPTSACL